MRKDLPEIQPCGLCGVAPVMETDKPMGRLRDVYRLICACGHSSPSWSVSAPAAIRQWNKFMTENADEGAPRRRNN
jgi:hypothetical protein